MNTMMVINETSSIIHPSLRQHQQPPPQPSTEGLTAAEDYESKEEARKFKEEMDRVLGVIPPKKTWSRKKKVIASTNDNNENDVEIYGSSNVTMGEIFGVEDQVYTYVYICIYTYMYEYV